MTERASNAVKDNPIMSALQRLNLPLEGASERGSLAADRKFH